MPLLMKVLDMPKRTLVNDKLEKEIEGPVSTYAESLGWLSYKFKSATNRGVPDRLYLRNGTCIFIEFKRHGEEAKLLQKYIHKLIRKAGFDVYVIDTLSDGYDLFNSI